MNESLAQLRLLAAGHARVRAADQLQALCTATAAAGSCWGKDGARAVKEMHGQLLKLARGES